MSNASAVEAVFFAALEKGTEAERAAYLDSACRGDAELRRQVEKLLKAHPRVGAFLKKPVAEQLAAPPEQADGTQELNASTDGPGAEPAARHRPTRARTESKGSGDADSALHFLQASAMPDSLGRLGHYEVLEVLGRGGFGIVFRAFDETLQRMVAIKVLAPQLAATSPPRKRFLREARSSAKVRHENVVQVYAVEEKPLPYLVMEFIPGETLQQRLDRTGPLGAAEVAAFGRQIAEGLAAAHGMGLIHRDIKPANILIEAGAKPCVKITDFGLARAADDASLTQSGMIAGTPLFMAPEQAKGEAFDHRADLFSLGSVLYTMCSGRPPFRANGALAVLKRVAEDTPRPIPEIIPEVPTWLCDLITRLHAKNPEDRIGTAQEVADLLGRGLAEMQRAAHIPAVGMKLQSREIPEEVPAKRPSRFRTSPWLAAAAVLLLLLGGLGISEATGVTDVHGVVIRLFSPEGTLVVEVDDPGVSVKIDGSELVITGAGAREIRVKPGSYTVEASKDGKVVSRELITVTNNGRRTVRISQEATRLHTKKEIDGQAKDPDRLAAEAVLLIGGIIKVNEQDKEIRVAADLPRESFRLTFVSLHENKQVTDADLVHFKGCKNLTYLDLWGTQVGDAGLVHFKDCKDLKVLFVPFTAVGDAGLAHFKDCKRLTDLELRFTQLTDAGLAYFKDCKDLTYLNLTSTNVGDAGLAHLKTSKNLKSIALDVTRVTDAGLAHLKNCKNLTELQLPTLPISDEGLAHLKDCKDLTIVNLNGTRVSDASVAHIKGLTNLKELYLKMTQVTAAGIDALKKALPKCTIHWDGGVIEPK